jgi:hypothetical protein
VAEGAPLLRAYTWKRIEGSNPSLSAIYDLKVLFYVGLVEIDGSNIRIYIHIEF